MQTQAKGWSTVSFRTFSAYTSRRTLSLRSLREPDKLSVSLGLSMVQREQFKEDGDYTSIPVMGESVKSPNGKRTCNFAVVDGISLESLDICTILTVVPSLSFQTYLRRKPREGTTVFGDSTYTFGRGQKRSAYSTIPREKYRASRIVLL